MHLRTSNGIAPPPPALGNTAPARALIIHPDAPVRQRLSAVLRGVFQVAECAEPPDDFSVPPELVVACPSVARRLLRLLERAAPTALRAFVTESPDASSVEELVDLASEGNVFHVVTWSSDAGQLLRQVQAVMSRRRSLRIHPRQELYAELELEDERLRLRCSNISNDGVLLVGDESVPVDRLVPGTRLDRLLLLRASGRVLSTAHATVRHLSATDGGLQVGVELLPPWLHPKSVDHSSTFITDRTVLLALIRRALRRQPQLACAPHGIRQGLTPFQAELSESNGARRIRCSTASGGWAPSQGDVLDVRLELSGKSYRGVASTLESFPGGFHLALPRVLEVQHRRQHQRFRPDADQPFVFRYSSPLTHVITEHPVCDLDVRGLSFAFDAASEVLPPGLVLEDCALILPDGTRESCQATVRTNAQQGQDVGHGPLRCGVELSSLTARARHAIFDGFVRSRSPEVKGASDVQFRQIWDLLNAARLFHPDYPFNEGPHLAKLEQVHQKLAAAEDGLCRTFAWVDQDKLAGHASGLRVSSRTWMLQHLAVQPGFHRSEQVSRELSMLAVDLAEALHDVEWVRILWRVENRWPDRIFGWIARAMAAPGLTQLRRVHYMRAPLTVKDAPKGADLPEVRRATPRDLALLERALRGRGELVRLLSDDLAMPRVGHEVLARRFAAAGLLRERNVLVAGTEEAPLGFALSDVATPGLCWSELTNAFQLVPASGPLAPQTVEALARACAAEQARVAAPSSITLARPEDVAALCALGYTDHGEVAEWTFHRRLARSWHTLMGTFFERLERRTQRPRDKGKLAA